MTLGGLPLHVTPRLKEIEQDIAVGRKASLRRKKCAHSVPIEKGEEQDEANL